MTAIGGGVGAVMQLEGLAEDDIHQGTIRW